MKFRWIGDPRNNFDGPDIIEKFDHVFTRTDWTDVEDKSVIAKLIGHSHFESAASVKADAIPAIPANPPKPVITDEREALIRDAEELGIAVDRRWSNLTLSAKIREALAA
jgi:hypothetical protein